MVMHGDANQATLAPANLSKFKAGSRRTSVRKFASLWIQDTIEFNAPVVTAIYDDFRM
jgi:hypothetical protein